MFDFICDTIVVFLLLAALSFYDFAILHIYFRYFYTGDFNEKIK